jgi:Glucodextranase, domain B/PASTA domain
MGRPGLLALLLVAFVSTASSAWAKNPHQPATSAITSPANGAELFYNGDNGSGSVTVAGTVSGNGWGSFGDLRCYWNNNANSVRVATKIPVNGGSFAANVSLFEVAGRVCRLALVQNGQAPTGSNVASFTGPAVSVSDQFSHSQNGSLYGYDILSGTLGYSFELGSAGECPITASFITDPVSLGSFTLFSGNACLLANNGTGTRASVQVDGLNAFAPGAISGLSMTAGFLPLAYVATFDANHDTVTVRETDALMICNAPGGYPPNSSTCPGLHSSGVQLQQTTTLIASGRVVRISQRFASIDGRSHSVDLQFAQKVQASSGDEPPGFAFPRQSSFAVHAAPDSFTTFPSGSSSIFVVGDPVESPSTSNPIGAITYSHPPTSATFTSGPNAQQATFVMHYAGTIPARGATVYQWAYSQSTSLLGISALEQGERDRFARPTLAIVEPRGGAVLHNAIVPVAGRVADSVGIKSLTVDGRPVKVGAGGGFITAVRLRRGGNQISVVAVNEAGNARVAVVRVTYAPAVCVVPRLRGKSVADADKALAKAHCAPGRISRTRSRSIAKGKVVASNPRAGTRHPAGSKVALVVSRGR